MARIKSEFQPKVDYIMETFNRYIRELEREDSFGLVRMTRKERLRALRGIMVEEMIELERSYGAGLWDRESVKDDSKNGEF